MQREDKEERREPQAFAIVLQCFGKAVSPPLPPPTTTIRLQRQPWSTVCEHCIEHGKAPLTLTEQSMLETKSGQTGENEEGEGEGKTRRGVEGREGAAKV